MKKIISVLFAIILICSVTLTSFAENNQSETVKLPRLVDYADILSDSEESKLLAKLDEISERQKFDVVIVTVDTLDGKTPMIYADDFYDYNGYGMGENNDGVLLLVSMEERDWWITTTGYGITAFTDAGIDYISDKFLPDMSDDNYYSSFNTYVELCDDFITQAKTGKPYDTGNLPKKPFPVFLSLGVALLVGFVIALISVSYMKSKLKTVRHQSAASDYTKQGSMNISESRDLFLYKKFDRKPKPKDNGSGSRTHTSSSGTSHGGGGGKF